MCISPLLGDAQLFSKGLYELILPSNNVWGLFALISLLTFDVTLFNFSNLMVPKWCIVVVLISISLMTNEIVFLYNPLAIFFYEVSIVLRPFSNWIIFSLFTEVLHMFWILIFFCQFYVIQVFPPVCCSAFWFLCDVSWWAEFLILT